MQHMPPLAWRVRPPTSRRSVRRHRHQHPTDSPLPDLHPLGGLHFTHHITMTNILNLSRQVLAYLDAEPQPELEAHLSRLALKHLGLAPLLQRLSPAELKALAEQVPLSPQMPAMLRSSLYTLANEKQTEAPTPKVNV
jgi:hypothetical protein